MSRVHSQDNHLLAKLSVYTSIGHHAFSYVAPQIWNAIAYLQISASHHQSVHLKAIHKHSILLLPFNFATSDCLYLQFCPLQRLRTLQILYVAFGIVWCTVCQANADCHHGRPCLPSCRQSTLEQYVPFEVTSAPTLPVFSTRLKTYLFQLSFPPD